MRASSARSPGMPSKRMPTSITLGKRALGSTRSSSASYSPNASSGSSVNFTSLPASLPRSIRMRLVEGRADFQDFVDMSLRAHVLKDVAHHALLVDHEGRAQQA